MKKLYLYKSRFGLFVYFYGKSPLMYSPRLIPKTLAAILSSCSPTPQTEFQ